MTLDYKVMEGSLYNTPPCWSIYVCGLVFKHLLAAGGLPGVKANNDAKAKLVRLLPDPCNPWAVQDLWRCLLGGSESSSPTAVPPSLVYLVRTFSKQDGCAGV